MNNSSKIHLDAKEELLKENVSVRLNLIGKGYSINGAGEQTFMKGLKATGGISILLHKKEHNKKWILICPYLAVYVHALADYVD